MIEEIIIRAGFNKVTKILKGGATRRHSSSIGVGAIKESDAFVLIHDAVMPFTSTKIIQECLTYLEDYVSVDVAIPSVDTIIKIDNNNFIQDIPDRAYIRRGLTPQGFHVGVLKQAHAMAEADGDTTATDDCGLILKYNLGKIYVVEGEKISLKVTNPEDVHLADKLFQIRSVHAPNNQSLEALKDRVIVVFGASRGIGESIGKIAGDYGANVNGFSRSNDIDIRSTKNIRSALEKVYQMHGHIDHVVVTSGILYAGSLKGRTETEIDEMVNVNFLGSIKVLQESYEYLAKTKGSIVLFTGAAYTRGRAFYAVYTATKAAIVNLVQGLADEYQSDGIRINAMNPERVSGLMREENFGNELSSTLLKPETVALATLKTLLSGLSGQVIDLRVNSD